MPAQRPGKRQVQGGRGARQDEEEGSNINGAENLQNLKWERHFYYHEEEEREV